MKILISKKNYGKLEKFVKREMRTIKYFNNEQNTGSPNWRVNIMKYTGEKIYK